MTTTHTTPATDLLTLPQAAAYLGMTEKQVRWWRYKGYGPQGVRLGGRVLYRKRDIDAFLEAAFSEVAPK